MTVGPTVTRYELELGPGVKVARVDEPAARHRLRHGGHRRAHPGADPRALGDRRRGPEPHPPARRPRRPARRRREAAAATGPLEVGIGKDIAGKAVFLDLATTPHLLIAGATGAGKSSGLNCIITSLLMRTTPEQVRLILVDPKQVEMGQYNRLPHLLTQPVTNPKKAANALGWAVKEMDRRYDLLSEVGFRDITGYNAAFDRGELTDDRRPGRHDGPASYERLPYIVVVVDELNDLMMVAARDVEDSITRIAQKARAVGIHLIVATQRPERERDHGRDQGQHPGPHRLRRVQPHRLPRDPRPAGRREAGRQGRHAAAARQLVGGPARPGRVRQRGGGAQGRRPLAPPGARGRRTSAASRATSGDDAVTSSANGFSGGGDEDDDAAILRQAMELVVRSQLGSTSMLQRKLKIGFARAGRVMDLLEQRGVVGPSEGSKARAVLMTVEEFELLQQARARLSSRSTVGRR